MKKIRRLQTQGEGPRMLALEPQMNLTHGLTPKRLRNILELADQGDILEQHLLFADMEDRCEHLAAEMGKRKRHRRDERDNAAFDMRREQPAVPRHARKTRERRREQQSLGRAHAQRERRGRFSAEQRFASRHLEYHETQAHDIRRDRNAYERSALFPFLCHADIIAYRDRFWQVFCM